MTKMHRLSMSNELLTYSRLLGIVARKLGHDLLLLIFESQPSEERWCSAVFGQYENYDTEPLEADGRRVSLKSIDAKGCLRSNESMHHELVELMYKTLENGGQLSDGKSEVDASDVPEFMIGCALNGINCLENREEMQVV